MTKKGVRKYGRRRWSYGHCPHCGLRQYGGGICKRCKWKGFTFFVGVKDEKPRYLLAARFRYFRHLKGWSIPEMHRRARAMGFKFSNEVYLKYEKGMSPSIETLERMAAILDIQVRDFFTGRTPVELVLDDFTEQIAPHLKNMSTADKRLVLTVLKERTESG